MSAFGQRVKWKHTNHLNLCLNGVLYCCTFLTFHTRVVFQVLGKNPVEKQPTANTYIFGEGRHPLLF